MSAPSPAVSATPGESTISPLKQAPRGSSWRSRLLKIALIVVMLLALFERELIAAQQAAYMETCIEDDEIALRMDAGRKALFNEGRVEVGPYQSPMEDGMQHFHEWYRGKLGDALRRQ
jgi:Ring hydroxylating alpha subunit (catalytic domain)